VLDFSVNNYAGLNVADDNTAAISTISPNSGTTLGGSTITVSGENFEEVSERALRKTR